MKCKGFFVTNDTQEGFNKIIRRIREIGIDAYNYHRCIPKYILILKKDMLSYKKGQQVIYFETDDLDINKMYLLGFGFEGLFEDEDKMMEVEKFGRYRCIIEEINNFEFDNNEVDVLQFKFDFV